MKKVLMVLMMILSLSVPASAEHVWGPTEGNYMVSPVLVGIDPDSTDTQFKKEIVSSEDVYEIVRQLKGKEVANTWQGEMIKGNYEIVLPLDVYIVGTGHGRGLAIHGKVVLDSVLRQYLYVMRVVLNMNGKKITIDVPIYDLIKGYKSASCFNPLIDQKVVEIPQITPTPTPTPEIVLTPTPETTPPPIETTVPKAPTPTPTPTPNRYVEDLSYFEKDDDSILIGPVFQAGSVTVIFVPERDPCPTEKPDPEPTPPPPDPTCPPDQTPPPAPTLPPAPNPTCPPTPPPQITTPENPNQPITPPDDELVPVGGGSSNNGTPPITSSPVEVVAPPPDNSNLIN